jgi:predicted metal-binding protein
VTSTTTSWPSAKEAADAETLISLACGGGRTQTQPEGGQSTARTLPPPQPSPASGGGRTETPPTTVALAQPPSAPALSPIAAAPECAITIFVCITCRGGRPLDLVPVPGAVLAEATARAAAGTGMTVRRVRCLANCNRGLSAVVRREGGWTYVFGHLDAAASAAAALVEGAKLFAHAPDGLMPWRGRPEPLKRGLIARTPPPDFAGESE